MASSDYPPSYSHTLLDPPPSYLSDIAETNVHCQTCTCRTRQIPDNTGDAGWASPGHVLIRVRLYDHPNAAMTKLGFSEIGFQLDEDGYIDYRKLALAFGVKEVMRQDNFGVFIVQTGFRECAEIVRHAVAFGYLKVVEYSRHETQDIFYRLYVPKSHVRVRWYPSPNSDMRQFEETLEPVDIYNTVSLGKIARDRGVLNVQVFNPRTKERIPTRYLRVLRPSERHRAMGDRSIFEMVMGYRSFIAVTDVNISLPTMHALSMEDELRLEEQIAERTGTFMPSHPNNERRVKVVTVDKWWCDWCRSCRMDIGPCPS